MYSGNLSTIGVEGKEYFWEYIYEWIDDHDEIKIAFRVNFIHEVDKEKWFDFKLLPVNDDTLKVTDMFKGKDEHLKTGLPEALILLSRKIFKKSIISSTNFQDYKISNRVAFEKATKVWQRLVKRDMQFMLKLVTRIS
ncbi:MAG: hypothetical protein IPF52_03010 [Saprospiraceae bacterium]|nr:hypothetical protein [Saprospiraceae bacterium]